MSHSSVISSSQMLTELLVNSLHKCIRRTVKTIPLKKSHTKILNICMNEIWNMKLYV